MPALAGSAFEVLRTPKGRALAKAGALCLIAGLVLWGGVFWTERGAAQSESKRLLGLFATDEETALRQAHAEAKAQLDLMRADRATRRDFLQRALQDSSAAGHLDRREQGFFISLSQVKSSDARALFDDAIVPALGSSFDPGVLRESIGLMQRWNSANLMSGSESDRLASELVANMLTTDDSDAIAQQAAAMNSLAKHMSPTAAARLASQLATRSIAEPRSNASEARLPALLALEEKLDQATAEKLLRQLVNRMFEVRDGSARRMLAQAAVDPCTKLGEKAAGDIAGEIVDRANGELDQLSMKAWMMVLQALTKAMGAAKAGELSGKFAPRMILDLSNPSDDSVFSAWRGLAAQASPSQAEQLASTISWALAQSKADADVLLRAAPQLAILHASPQTFANVAKLFAERIAMGKNPAALSNLAEAAAVLREKIPQADVEQAAAILVTHMISERDAPVIGRMAAVLDDLDEGLSKTKAGALATTIAARMSAETRPAVLLGLASGFIAVAERMDHAQAGGLANMLVAKMRGEQRADVLRTLAFSLASIADGVNPAKIQSAGAELAASMAHETGPDELRSLASGLYALKDKAGKENFEKAAESLTARIRLERDASRIHDLVASLAAIADLSGGRGMQESANAILHNVLATKDPIEIRAGETNLALILPELEEDDAAEPAQMVIAKIAMEHDPDRLRAYGAILGLFPKGSLTETDFAKLAVLFAIPDAPCQIAALVQNATPASLSRAILNPLCGENSWASVVSAFDDQVKRGIVQHGKKDDDDEAIADFKSLVIADDDDESSAAAVKDSEGAGIEIDFNKLSDALDGLRPRQPIRFLAFAGRIVSLALVLAGLGLLLLEWRNRQIASKRAGV